jgi:hypothetical protein
MIGSVMESEANSVPRAGKASGRSRRLPWAILLLVVALGIFAGAFWYVGGTGYLGSLLPSSGQSKASVPASVTASVATASDSSEFARRMYVEQLESHAVLDRFADGDLESLVIKRVQTGEGSATVDVLAAFTDGTYADGVMSLVERGGAWYFFSLTGLRKGTTPGYSSSVAGFEAQEGSHTVEAAADAEGITTFDQGVIDTLMAEQPKHQALTKSVFDGTYNAMNFSAPKRGVGTVTIPMTLTGPGGKATNGEVVLIRKQIDGQMRTFLITLGP